MRGIRNMRADVFCQTEAMVKNEGYYLPDGARWVDLQVTKIAKTSKIRAGAPSSKYCVELLDEANGKKRCTREQVDHTDCEKDVDASKSLSVDVIQEDCLIVAQEHVRNGNRVAVLNMASAGKPGGGFRSGAGAQEENLHRRSDLWRFLSEQGKKYYPLTGDCALLSEDVTVFRGTERNGYDVLPEPFQICVISCAALRNPHLAIGTPAGFEPELSTKSVQETRVRVQAILSAARSSACKVIVLSAFGCGAFGNPPRHVATIFREVLATEYANEFSKVIFSIIDDHNAWRSHNPQGNVLPFKEVFADP